MISLSLGGGFGRRSEGAVRLVLSMELTNTAAQFVAL